MKGFTLIEILAVITLLAVVGLIAVPTVSTVINDSKKRASDVQIKEIEQAAKDWTSYNLKLLSKDSPYYLNIDTLVDEGYFEKDIVDPKTDKKITGCVKISYNEKYNNYDFKFGECVE